MDICMFSPFTHNAPSTYRILSFAKVLAQRGHNLTIVLPTYDRYSSFRVEYSEGTDGIQLIKPFQLKTSRMAVNMGPYIFSAGLNSLGLKCDVIHVLKPTPLSCSGYVPKFCLGTPVVQDIDDLDHVVMAAEKHSGASTWVMEQCERFIPRFADQIIVSCSALKTLYSSMGMADKINQIPNGVFVKDFEVEKDVKLKDQYALRDKVVVYVGSLNNEAQLHPLIYAMQKVVSQKKGISCLIVGDGSAKQSLQQLTKRLGLEECVVFTGRVPHAMVPRFLSVSDLGFACFPNLDYLKYASNIKVFEYMAAGVPAIVNSNGDLPFYVDYGSAGLIADPSVDNLSRAVVDVLSDDKRCRRLSTNAKAYVKNFDWYVLAKELFSVYCDVAN